MNVPFNLRHYNITVGEVHRNLPPSQLYEHAIRYEGTSIAVNGARGTGRGEQSNSALD